MKITFIQPAIGRKKDEPYIKSWKTFPPLPFAILKSLTPPDVETELIDDRIEFIDYGLKTDLVALSAESCNALRAYNISRAFRDRGVPVVIGGSQATFTPGEVQQHADAVYVGNAEDKWPELVADLRNGSLKKSYVAAPGFGSVAPDKSIYKGKKYSGIDVIETARGCFYDCSICSIANYYKKRHFTKDLRLTAKEFDESGSGYVFLLDDNLIADPAYLERFLREITPFKKKWIAQTSINIAKHEKLLEMTRKAGCLEVLIGFETLDPGNLEAINKKWHASFGDMDELIKKINGAGISIYANFVLGFDNDTAETFDRILEFSNRHAFQMAGYNTLLPYPETPIYHYLVKENRMDAGKWWLNPGFRFGDIPFIPKRMSKTDLVEGAKKLRKDFYKLSSVVSRFSRFFKYHYDPVLSLLVLSEYLGLNHEIDAKIGIPLAMNLDDGKK